MPLAHPASADASNLYLELTSRRYTDEQNEVWNTLYRRMQPLWKELAHPAYLSGLERLHLRADRIPQLAQVNAKLAPLSGFRAMPVAGYVPSHLFFESLRRREFPTTVTIRPATQLDYLPEPDIFHDVCGHVPMHTDAAFSSALVKFGECAAAAGERARAERDPGRRAEVHASMMRALARAFWFTVEFGLIRTPQGLRAYGSGLMSSHGELQHAVLSPDVEREAFHLDWVVNQAFDIDHYQPLVAVIGSFEQLYSEIETLCEWLVAGKLDRVAGGAPEVMPKAA
jgi:phenylalanine-4-hydroxylase